MCHWINALMINTFDSKQNSMNAILWSRPIVWVCDCDWDCDCVESKMKRARDWEGECPHALHAYAVNIQCVYEWNGYHVYVYPWILYSFWWMEPCYPLNKAKNIKNNGNNHINTTTNLGFDRSIDSGIQNIQAHIHAQRFICTQSNMWKRTIRKNTFLKPMHIQWIRESPNSSDKHTKKKMHADSI